MKKIKPLGQRKRIYIDLDKSRAAKILMATMTDRQKRMKQIMELLMEDPRMSFRKMNRRIGASVPTIHTDYKIIREKLKMVIDFEEKEETNV